MKNGEQRGKVQEQFIGGRQLENGIKRKEKRAMKKSEFFHNIYNANRATRREIDVLYPIRNKQRGPHGLDR